MKLVMPLAVQDGDGRPDGALDVGPGEGGQVPLDQFLRALGEQAGRVARAVGVDDPALGDGGGGVDARQFQCP